MLVLYKKERFLHKEEFPDDVAATLLLANLEVQVGEGNSHDEAESNPKPFGDLKFNLKI